MLSVSGFPGDGCVCVCVCVREDLEVKVSDCFTPRDQPLTLYTSKKVGSVTKLLLGHGYYG